MTTINLKSIAAAGAISAALSFAALGLGAGAANADDGANIPFMPGGSVGDWQSYFPLIERLADVADFVKIPDSGTTGTHRKHRKPRRWPVARSAGNARRITERLVQVTGRSTAGHRRVTSRR